MFMFTRTNALCILKSVRMIIKAGEFSLFGVPGMCAPCK